MQVSLVDLDPKAVSKIPEHYELDKKIVRICIRDLMPLTRLMRRLG
jgi:hypothetical protein